VKLFRKNKKKENKHRRSGWMVIAAAALASLVWISYSERKEIHALAKELGALVIESEYFRVREFKVVGGDKIGGSEIVSLAGLSHGMNMWKIHPENIEEKLKRHPWLRHVSVRREFPHRIVIRVEERLATAIVVLNRLYYVDGDGVLFKEVGRDEKVDFPLVTGLKISDFETDREATQKKIQEALRLNELFAGRSMALSEIHFASGPQSLKLYPMAFPVAITFGWGDWQNKLSRLEKVMAVWKGKESRLAFLDLSFDHQVVVRLKEKSRSMERNA